jgi:hypothetical protein
MSKSSVTMVRDPGPVTISETGGHVAETGGHVGPKYAVHNDAHAFASVFFSDAPLVALAQANSLTDPLRPHEAPKTSAHPKHASDGKSGNFCGYTMLHKCINPNEFNRIGRICC